MSQIDFNVTKLRRALCIILPLLIPTSLHASSFYDQLFQTGTLTSFMEGDQVSYHQSWNFLSGERATGEADLILEFVSDEKIILKLKNDNAEQALGQFPQMVGNPVNMYFLETVISQMARISGGSPFYIRNRLKDALLTEALSSGECTNMLSQLREINCLKLVPFEHDEARNRMGDFADLTLVFAVDNKDPLRIILLNAHIPNQPDGFSLNLEAGQ